MKRTLLWGIVLAGTIGLILLIWLLDIPSWKSLDMDKLVNPSQTTVVYDADGQAAAGLHNGENRVVVSVEEIPMHVKNAFIAIEDARFYEHPGIDLWRICGSLVNNLKAGAFVEGGSTITQQLIKLTHLTSQKTLSRKAQEAWLALQLERQVEKDEILGMYLNAVYFGNGAYGIETAAQTYFGKSCRELSLLEGALLAGIIKAPGSYAPHINPEKAKERCTLVLNAMVREEMISREEADAAAQGRIRLAESDRGLDEGSWYVDWAFKEAGEVLSCSTEELLSGGYRIYTALSPVMQMAAEELFAYASYFPGNASDGTRPEAAMIAVNPKNGEIMCMIGGRSYETRRGLNRATQIKRQPGSAFKPISVYAAAIDFLGYTPVSMVNDAARDFGGGYTPSNASGNEYGTVTLRQALARSMNLATVDLLTQTGIDAACMYAKRAGIPLVESDMNLSIALGSMTEGVSPAQMSAAYAPLANGGYRVTPHTVRRIEDLYGRVLYEHRAEHEYVMNEKSARMLTSILEDAVEYGTAKQLASVGFPVAAKTGTVGYTTGGNRDIWTIAYTPAVSIAVWQGFDQPTTEHILPDGVTGGSYPAKLAAAFLKQTKELSDGGAFVIPDGMQEVLLDVYALTHLHTPMQAGERTPSEYLLPEILPDEDIPVLTSNLWDEPRQVETIYVQTNHDGKPVISFVAPDSFAQYRIIREEDGVQTEVGCIEGTAGEYLTFVDETFDSTGSVSYCVISRHKGFYECGSIVESAPSETAEYQAAGLLERILWRNRQNEQADEVPLFGENGTSE